MASSDPQTTSTRRRLGPASGLDAWPRLVGLMTLIGVLALMSQGADLAVATEHSYAAPVRLKPRESALELAAGHSEMPAGAPLTDIGLMLAWTRGLGGDVATVVRLRFASSDELTMTTLSAELTGAFWRSKQRSHAVGWRTGCGLGAGAADAMVPQFGQWCVDGEGCQDGVVMRSIRRDQFVLYAFVGLQVHIEIVPLYLGLTTYLSISTRGTDQQDVGGDDWVRLRERVGLRAMQAGSLRFAPFVELVVVASQGGAMFIGSTIGITLGGQPVPKVTSKPGYDSDW